MCLVKSPLRNLSRWNWDGDVIIRESVVPSSRPVVGSHSLTEKPKNRKTRKTVGSKNRRVTSRCDPSFSNNRTMFLKCSRVIPHFSCIVGG
jgi:hypothetical protein